MENYSFIQQIEKLPKNLRDEVKDFVDFIVTKYGKSYQQNKEREFGYGKAKMSSDFNAPLEEFKDYQ
ncbi:MAG: DUF2281 domain-containing protein [Rickettsiales bacterium]|nr:DUF2281 domain-containing protein [Rickettsiales bacterium]